MPSRRISRSTVWGDLHTLLSQDRADRLDPITSGIKPGTVQSREIVDSELYGLP
jgi:hypothetical protein